MIPSQLYIVTKVGHIQLYYCLSSVQKGANTVELSFVVFILVENKLYFVPQETFQFVELLQVGVNWPKLDLHFSHLVIQSGSTQILFFLLVISLRLEMTNATIVLFIPTVKLVKGKVCCFVISTIYIIITVTVPEKSRLSLKECCTAESKSICAIFMGLGWRLIKISKVPNSARKTCRYFPY